MSRLLLITPPQSEPVTADYVKRHSHIIHDVEDDLFAEWIKTGRELVETTTRRSLIEQVWELSFDTWPTLPIKLPRSPVSAITSIVYYDYENSSTEINSENYQLDTSASPARVDFVYGYTLPSVTLRKTDAIKIRYTAGYGDSAEDVPSIYKDAITFYCGYRNGLREGENGSLDPFYNLITNKKIHLE